MASMSVTQMRLERLADERARIEEMVSTVIGMAEEDKRPLNESEQDQLAKYRSQIDQFDAEIEQLAGDVERGQKSRDVSAIIRVNEPDRPQDSNGPTVYRTFAAFARDQLISRYPILANQVDGAERAQAVREAAMERLQRVEHTLTSDVEGLLPPQHMAQIMDIINSSRPVVASANKVDLSRGTLTYPKIAQRPEVLIQGTEKTEAGTANMQVTLESLTADTYLGGGNLSWQTINWSTPDALQLWFNLAAEAYARQTESAACDELAGTAAGTASAPLGTSGTESFAAWRASVQSGIADIYSNTSGRQRTNTLYLSAARFFQLAGVGSDQVLQLSAVGNLDVGSMTGTFWGLRVIGSYGFSDANTAIVGDSSAFLVGETPGAPVEMRAVEPAIGGMEVGVIGAFKSKVFDPDRFIHLT